MTKLFLNKPLLVPGGKWHTVIGNLIKNLAFMIGLPKPHAGTPTVLIDELDAGCLQSLTYFCDIGGKNFPRLNRNVLPCLFY